MSSSTTQGYQGVQQPNDTASEFAATRFMINQMINRLWTADLVEVTAVAEDGSISIKPMVNQVTGNGIAQPHGPINGVKYLQWQNGAAAIVSRPQVGDRGLAVFCRRDISSVKKTKAAANPGSNRKYDPADAIYLGGVLNGNPTTTLTINNGGVSIQTTGTVSFQGTNGTLDGSGNLTLNGDVIANKGGGQVSLANHLTSGVESGAAQSGPPVPGT